MQTIISDVLSRNNQQDIIPSSPGHHPLKSQPCLLKTRLFQETRSQGSQGSDSENAAGNPDSRDEKRGSRDVLHKLQANLRMSMGRYSYYGPFEGYIKGF